jgi:hypothetical protein
LLKVLLPSLCAFRNGTLSSQATRTLAPMYRHQDRKLPSGHASASMSHPPPERGTGDDQSRTYHRSRAPAHSASLSAVPLAVAPMQHRMGEWRGIAQLDPGALAGVPPGSECQRWTQTAQQSDTVPPQEMTTLETGLAPRHMSERTLSPLFGYHHVFSGHACRKTPCIWPAGVQFSRQPSRGTLRHAPTADAGIDTYLPAILTRGRVVWSIRLDKGPGWKKTLSARTPLSSKPSSCRQLTLILR